MRNTALTLLKRIKISPQPAIAGGRLNATRSCYHGPIHSKISNNKASDCHNTQLSFVSYETPVSKSQKQTPLVIQHCLFGRKENFFSLGKKFHHLTKRSVIIPDARNHGNSPSCSTPSLKQMSTDLVNLSCQLGIEKTNLLGHASGGRIAMLASLLYPKLIDRLVVVDSSPLNSDVSIKRWERLREACYIANTIMGGKNRESGESYGVDVKFEIDEALKNTLKDKSERALFLSNLGRFDTESLLNNPDLGRFPNMMGSTFNGPTMFITGEKKSSWESDADIRGIKQLFPNSYFVKIPNAGQWVHTEKEDEFLAAAVTFLQTEF